MLNYLIRRVMIGVLTLMLITLIVYGLIRSMPGDPVTVAQSDMDPRFRPTPEDVERMRETYGLNDRIHVGYLKWLKNVAKLDLGRSYRQKQPVAQLIRERMVPTLLLSVTSLSLAYMLALPMGLWATMRSGRWDERFVSVLLYMLYSFPSFVAALFLQLAFAVKLGWLPLFGMESDNYASLTFLGKVWDVFLHALMPVTCMTYGTLAYDTRFVKANLEEVVRQDYIRTARAKGVSRFRIMTHHALRNTMIPLVTLLGLSIPGLLSGAVILEQIFSWPGMGLFFFESIAARDYPAIMGLVLILSVLTLGGQLLADLLYAVVDPRVSYS